MLSNAFAQNRLPAHLDARILTGKRIGGIDSAGKTIARTLCGDPAPIEIKPAPVIVKTPCYALALVPPPMQAGGSGKWHAEIENGRTICRFYDAQGMLAGFGVAPQEAAVWQSLLAGLGMARPEKPLAAVEQSTGLLQKRAARGA